MYRSIIRFLATSPNHSPTPTQFAGAHASESIKQSTKSPKNKSSTVNFDLSGHNSPSSTPADSGETNGNTNTSSKSTSFSTQKEPIPDVMVTFGTRMNQITFVSHPGVMAVSKLLEMHAFTTTKTTLTQENVDAIKEFDEELAAKAQIAVDNGLSINFADMEYIDKPDVLEMFINEKKSLSKIAQDVMAMPPNDYSFPPSMDSYQKPEIPTAYRPELVKEQEMLQATPEGREYLALHQAAQELIDKTVTSESPKKEIPLSSTPQLP